MRIPILILALASFLSAKAQTFLPVTGINDTRQSIFAHQQLLNDSNRLQQKWSVSGYGGIGAGIGFFNGFNTAFLPAQIGLQLNRRLNNNLYAFVGVDALPVYFNFNRSLRNTDLSKTYLVNPGFGTNRWGLYSGIQAGLMYVNDAKTFSISGSVGISNSSYPVYAVPRANTQKQLSAAGFRQ